MHEKDGIETVREILAIDPAAVVFTMSGADDDYQEVARMLGARRGFRKPVEIAALTDAVRQHIPFAPGKVPARTILVVGGNRLMRALLIETLAHEGYPASSVATAAEALEALKSDSPALLLLNTLGPIPEWTAFVGQVRKMAPALPVVVQTGFQLWPEIINPLLDLGVRRVISKSTKTQEILEAVSDAIGQGRL